MLFTGRASGEYGMTEQELDEILALRARVARLEQNEKIWERRLNEAQNMLGDRRAELARLRDELQRRGVTLNKTVENPNPPS